jgi:hypothetical protein
VFCGRLHDDLKYEGDQVASCGTEEVPNEEISYDVRNRPYHISKGSLQMFRIACAFGPNSNLCRIVRSVQPAGHAVLTAEINLSL